MATPTLNELHKLQSSITDLEREATSAQRRATQLRSCGGKSNLFAWWLDRTSGYGSRDYDGLTQLLVAGIEEFGPRMLEILAKRQDLIAHQSTYDASLKRSELGVYVALESPPT